MTFSLEQVQLSQGEYGCFADTCRSGIPANMPGAGASEVIVRPSPALTPELVVTCWPVEEVAIALGDRGVAGTDDKIGLLRRARGALRKAKITSRHEEADVARSSGTDGLGDPTR